MSIQDWNRTSDGSKLRLAVEEANADEDERLAITIGTYTELNEYILFEML